MIGFQNSLKDTLFMVNLPGIKRLFFKKIITGIVGW